ncbi:hypothetical protein EYF80_011930 [Liparis tanakae]|uniref:Uncharacterized protein n=1 Tax=Liparis tanakae TaxID=230148 RepID=A0A4Z2IL08_9TELE|nr:hypothetical protein EYF80_011930 [Liparis tanakae]
MERRLLVVNNDDSGYERSDEPGNNNVKRERVQASRDEAAMLRLNTVIRQSYSRMCLTRIWEAPQPPSQWPAIRSV